MNEAWTSSGGFTGGFIDQNNGKSEMNHNGSGLSFHRRLVGELELFL